MEKRKYERRETLIPVSVTTASGSWTGTCLNLSLEGALLKLDRPWDGSSELSFLFDPKQLGSTEPMIGKVIRAGVVDKGASVAVRFRN